MRRIISTIFIIITLNSFCFSQGIVRLTNGESPPYQSEYLPNNGYVSQIVTESFELVDLTVEYGFFPWKRAYENARNGSWNGSVVWVKTDERADEILFSSPVAFITKLMIFKKSNVVDYNTAADLKGLKIGRMRGYTYGSIFDEASNDGIFYTYDFNSLEMGINMLIFGKIDALAGELEVAKDIIHTHTSFTSNQFEFGKVMDVSPLSVVFTKNDRGAELLAKFEEGLFKLKESGRYKELVQPYE